MELTIFDEDNEDEEQTYSEVRIFYAMAYALCAVP